MQRSELPLESKRPVQTANPFKVTIASLAGLVVAINAVGCTNYGGSVPIDDDAGIQSHGGRHPVGSVDASVPIDDDAGIAKPTAPKP